MVEFNKALLQYPQLSQGSTSENKWAELIRVAKENDARLKETVERITDFGSNGVYWDDLFCPLTSSKLGVNDKPDFDYTNVGYLFPQNDTSEAVYLIVQMPHKWKIGTTIKPHVHYRRTAAGKPTFKIDYCWFNVGEAVETPTTTLTLDVEEMPYTSGSIQQVNTNEDGISGAGKGLSSILLVKLYRDDNTVSGDVLTYQFDIHYQIDAPGSKQEYIK
jgi:hypothetical protein